MIAGNYRSVDESTRHRVPASYWDRALHKPVNEFLNREGKRIRADLVELAYAMSNCGSQAPSQLQSFVELLHAGSLIVDDIQDDAETRRRRPTLHRMVGTPLAINTGNWMYFAAFEKLTELPISAFRQSLVMKRTLRTVRGCHEGQALDLTADVRTVARSDMHSIVLTISRLKTGGLVSLAAWLGAAVAGAAPELRRSLNRFGMRLGIALQMQNDLAELTSCSVENTTSRDLANFRVTWPWAWATKLCDAAEITRLQNVDDIATLSTRLYECVGVFGAKAVRSGLRQAIDDLRLQLGEGEAREESKRILDRLEKYHV